jgi:glyceraldehyde-3-phosphate dehydrogenase (NAD(P))
MLRAALYEVAAWENLLKERGNELFHGYIVNNQANAIPETVTAIHALAGVEADGRAWIARTAAALGSRAWRW